MTDSDVYEIRCDDCKGIFVDGVVLHIIGWLQANPRTTIEDEVSYDYDAGNLCKSCYNYRISQLQQSSTRF